MTLVEIAALLGLELLVGLGGWAIYEARQKGRIWAVEINTNTGRAKVRRVKPDHEGYTIRTKGRKEVFVKLEDAWMYPTNKGGLAIVDADTGFIQRLKGGEGRFEGLDGKTWASYMKASVIEMIASASGSNLAALLKYAIIGICLLGAIMIGGLFALAKYLGPSAPPADAGAAGISAFALLGLAGIVGMVKLDQGGIAELLDPRNRKATTNFMPESIVPFSTQETMNRAIELVGDVDGRDVPAEPNVDLGIVDDWMHGILDSLPAVGMKRSEQIVQIGVTNQASRLPSGTGVSTREKEGSTVVNVIAAPAQAVVQPAREAKRGLRDRLRGMKLG